MAKYFLVKLSENIARMDSELRLAPPTSSTFLSSSPVLNTAHCTHCTTSGAQLSAKSKAEHISHTKQAGCGHPAWKELVQPRPANTSPAIKQELAHESALPTTPLPFSDDQAGRLEKTFQQSFPLSPREK